MAIQQNNVTTSPQQPAQQGPGLPSSQNTTPSLDTSWRLSGSGPTQPPSEPPREPPRGPDQTTTATTEPAHTSLFETIKNKVAQGWQFAKNSVSQSWASITGALHLIREERGWLKTGGSIVSTAVSSTQITAFGLGVIELFRSFGSDGFPLAAVVWLGLGVAGKILSSMNQRFQQNLYLSVEKALDDKLIDAKQKTSFEKSEGSSFSQRYRLSAEKGRYYFEETVGTFYGLLAEGSRFSFALFAIATKAPLPFTACACAGVIFPIVKELFAGNARAKIDHDSTEQLNKYYTQKYVLTSDPASSRDIRTNRAQDVLRKELEATREKINKPKSNLIDKYFKLSVADIIVGTGFFGVCCYLAYSGMGAKTLSKSDGIFLITVAYSQFVDSLLSLGQRWAKLSEAGTFISNFKEIYVNSKQGDERSVIKKAREWFQSLGRGETVQKSSSASIDKSPDTSSPERQSTSRTVLGRIPRIPTITITNGSYRYPSESGSESPEVISDLSIVIDPGTKLMICGENGSGKSTVIDILTKLRKMEDGKVFIDGVDMNNLSEEEWLEQIGACFQDFSLFKSISFRKGLLLDRDYSSEEYLNRVLAVTGISKILDEEISKDVKRFPQGLDTIYGTQFGGTELSGGERQRFAVARALLRRPAVIFLDEFTSQLDPEHAKELYDFILDAENTMGYKPTIIYTTHDYRKGKHSDNILYFTKSESAGRVKRRHMQGTFEKLMQDPSFKRKHEACS